MHCMVSTYACQYNFNSQKATIHSRKGGTYKVQCMYTKEEGPMSRIRLLRKKNYPIFHFIA